MPAATMSEIATTLIKSNAAMAISSATPAWDLLDRRCRVAFILVLRLLIRIEAVAAAVKFHEPGLPGLRIGGSGLDDEGDLDVQNIGRRVKGTGGGAA